ncbi:MAG: hypothetical protein WC307_05820 [Candidatus Nanoarchaeia archaeon]|jgi:hypothetical protein
MDLVDLMLNKKYEVSDEFNNTLMFLEDINSGLNKIQKKYYSKVEALNLNKSLSIKIASAYIKTLGRKVANQFKIKALGLDEISDEVFLKTLDLDIKNDLHNLKQFFLSDCSSSLQNEAKKEYFNKVPDLNKAKDLLHLSYQFINKFYSEDKSFQESNGMILDSLIKSSGLAVNNAGAFGDKPEMVAFYKFERLITCLGDIIVSDDFDKIKNQLIKEYDMPKFTSELIDKFKNDYIKVINYFKDSIGIGFDDLRNNYLEQKSRANSLVI